MADNGIIGHIALLQRIHAAIPGVVSAPEAVTGYPVNEIPDSDLPFVMVLPGPGAWRQENFNAHDRQDRNYEVTVFVNGIGDGTPGERLENAIIMMQRFGGVYLGRNAQQLQAPSNGPPRANQIVLKATTEGIIDGGFDPEIVYGNGSYSGFVFTVGVYEKGSNDGSGS